MLINTALLFVLMQGASTVVRYVDLAAARPSEPAEFQGLSSETRGCSRAFNSQAPQPLESCYPFPVSVSIITYKPGAGYTKASLVVRVTNSGKGPIVLPVGNKKALPQGEAGDLSFSVHLGNDVGFIGFGSAFGDTGEPPSLAAIQPRESIEYEIPVEVETIKAKLHPERGSTVPLVVKLHYYKMKRRGDGGITYFTDTNDIPSETFRIPYPE